MSNFYSYLRNPHTGIVHRVIMSDTGAGYKRFTLEECNVDAIENAEELDEDEAAQAIAAGGSGCGHCYWTIADPADLTFPGDAALTDTDTGRTVTGPAAVIDIDGNVLYANRPPGPDIGNITVTQTSPPDIGYKTYSSGNIPCQDCAPPCTCLAKSRHRPCGHWVCDECYVEHEGAGCPR